MDLGEVLKKTLAGAGAGAGGGYLYSGDKEGAIKGAEIGAVAGLLTGLYQEYTKPDEQVPTLPPNYDSSYVYDPNRPNQQQPSYSNSVARVGLQYMQNSRSLQDSILAGADALTRIAQSGSPEAQNAATYALQMARSARSAEEQQQIIVTTLQSLAGAP